MKAILTTLLLLVAPFIVFGWGATGHRVTGEIAEQHLSKKTKKRLGKIMGDEGLALASTWMDEIKSAPGTRHLNPWHYVSIPDSLTYETSEKNPKGDIIWAIETITDSIINYDLTINVERELLRMLIHLIGDIHQPLHVGRAEDKGGNSIRVKWFGSASNLHRVWDSEMINGYKMSYTELAANLPTPSKEQITTWQNSSPRDWAVESMSYRQGIYNYPNERLGYRYQYNHFDTVKERLLQAGIRIAAVLNEIYG